MSLTWDAARAEAEVHSGKQFDVGGAVLACLQGLSVDLDIQCTAQFDDSAHIEF